MLIVLLGFILNRVLVEASINDDVLRLCNHLKVLDNRILKTLRELPKYEGEYVVKDIKDYNAGLNTLLQLLTDHRNATLEVEEAVEFLKDGAPDYFKANIDPDKAKLHWGWLGKGLDEVYQLRAQSIKVWSNLNRNSRLIALEFYSYPDGMNYTGYQNPNFPPLREKKASIYDMVVWLCKTLKEMDERIKHNLKALPVNGGEFVLKDITDYNAGLKRLLQFLTEDRNGTVEVGEAVELLKVGAPEFYQVNIENEKAKLRWGWLQEGMDKVYKLRVASIEIWTSINKISQLIPLTTSTQRN